jgi:hypothetical protein
VSAESKGEKQGKLISSCAASGIYRQAVYDWAPHLVCGVFFRFVAHFLYWPVMELGSILDGCRLVRQFNFN